MALDIGSRLGAYEIVAAIGAGGMGEVYRARDTKLGRDVAIKVLPDEFARDRERLDRFEREARLLAQLNHASIAMLHGLEDHEGQRFLVMELVEGETLAERIAAGAIPIDEAIPLFVQIAEGLEAAHDKGIIHRDLKPANIRIGPDGKPKILDFGLAKAFAPEQDGAVETSQSPTLTKGTALGAIMGTAGYMSPEQARGKVVDKRTDVWAFACCLYEALTMRGAFDGETTTDILTAVIHREPDWSRLPATTPANVTRLLRRCFQKDPRERLHDIADARLELKDDSHEAETVRPGSRSPLLAMSFMTVLALGAVLWSFSRGGSAREPRVARFTLPLPEGEELLISIANPSVAISPDGQQLAWVTRGFETGKLSVRSVSELEVREVEGAERAQAPFFSPDGRTIGFVEEGAIWKVPVSGGAPTKIFDFAGNQRGAAWTHDDTIVLSLPDGLHRIAAASGDSETIAQPDRGNREKSFRFPEWLPGGRAVVFTTGTADMDTWDEATIAVVSLESGEVRTLVAGGTNARYSPSGHLLYARGQRLYAVPFDASSLEITGSPVEVLDGLSTYPSNGPAQFALSAEGTLVYAPGSALLSRGRVRVVSRNGDVAPEPLVETPRSVRRLRLSPDGARLALEVLGANHSIWTYDMERRALTPLLSGFNNFDPLWSPDGAALAFASDETNLFDLYRASTDGSGERERLLDDEDTVRLPRSWSPDGRSLLYRAAQTGTRGDLMVLSFDENRETRFLLRTPANEYDAKFSPDGRWVAYDSDESGRREVYLTSFHDPGPKWQVSTDGGALARWNRRGGELFYLNDDKLMAVDIDFASGRPELGQPRLLFEVAFTAVAGVDYEPMQNGESFLMIEDVEGDPPPRELVLVQNFAEELKRLAPHEGGP